MQKSPLILHKNSAEDSHAALVARHGTERQELFDSACVGIAGLGGLGSHVAIMLTRLGVGKLILVDFDKVDETNLHRQNYTFKDIGRPKTEALLQQLREINPYLDYTIHTERLTPENIPTIFSACDIICEAFDKAIEKAMLVETVLGKMVKPFLVGGSGMAGTGSPHKMKIRKPMSRYYLCGDGESSVETDCLFAPRVTLCAAQQAMVIMQLILKEINLDF